MSKILEATVDAVAALGSIHVTPDTTKANCLALPNTSQKIRYLLSLGHKRGAVEKLLYDYGVRTKDGAPIRYQFINNVMNQKIK